MVKKIKNLILGLIFILFQNCQSVQKINQHIDTPLSVKKIHKDIDFVQYKLFKLHPSLDLYISSKDLKFKFDSLKRSIKEPLKPNEFYLGISKVVASVRQGHTIIQPLYKQIDSNKLKVLKKRGVYPLSLFSFSYINNELIITQNYSKDPTIKVGTVVKSIQGITPQFLFTKYAGTEASDGYNQTYYNRAFANKVVHYFKLEKIVIDSIQVDLLYKDSVYKKLLTRVALTKGFKKEIAKKPIDSIKKVSKRQKEAKLLKERQLEIKKTIFGYDEIKKEFTRQLLYPAKDSSFAVLRIKKFVGGKQLKAYQILFKEINTKKINTLVLDLRNNGGGSIEEIQNLFTYISPDFVNFVDTLKVTNRTSLTTNMFRNVPKGILISLGPIIVPYAIRNLFSIKKSPRGFYYQKSKLTNRLQPKDNNYQGKLYVLIDGGSFSASSVLSANLQNIKRGIFVGEETGGAFNSTVAGTLPVLTLPYSKLKFRVGMMEIGVIKKSPIKGRGVMPEIILSPKKEDYQNHLDVELQWIANKEGQVLK
ncbi:S41 family peptidase [Flavobacterium oreochromis]|uniref:S41 family peptidase n=1 Tax=Flavobacterium oreochromis TaxID=2906078 RepID=UPI00385E5282